MSERTSISAKVIADSVVDDSRLTTFEVTFPRFVLAEFNTHRMLSRNSASSRAIPVWKRLKDILDSPFVPVQFGKNKAGMQSEESIPDEDNISARINWLIGRDIAVLQAYRLVGGHEQIMADSKGNPQATEVCEQISKLGLKYEDVFSRMPGIVAGVHKQHANRVLEPYAWHTVIVTGVYWRNFYSLRASVMAQPEIQDLAIAMARAHLVSRPCKLDLYGWHLPFVSDDDKQEVSDPIKLARLSSARCARVSYLTHDGKRSLDKDFEMADMLQGNGHMSPFEHPAMRYDSTGAHFGIGGGNFGNRWIQYRKKLENEHDFSRHITRDALVQGMKGDEELVDFVLAMNEFHP